MTFVQLFLLVNAALFGAVLTLAVQYFMAHKHAKKHPRAQHPDSPLSPEMKERLTRQAEDRLQGIVNRSALQLQHDLGATSKSLSGQLEKFGTRILDEEVSLFRKNVADLRATTQASVSSAQDDVTERQAALIASIAERQTQLDTAIETRRTELEAQLETAYVSKQQAVDQAIDAKLNDAVITFLIETLGHEADLGAQSDYLMKTLDEHKAELQGKKPA